MKQTISIVIPAYNEEEVIPQLCKRLKKMIDSLSEYQFEVIIVENGSKDKTIHELLKAREKDKRIKILQLSKNEGCDGAIVAGLHFAQGHAAIVMMADLQEPPEILPKFINKWKEGYDVVYGIVTKREKIPITRKINTFLYYKLIRLITNNLVIENASDFRLMDKKVYSLIPTMPEHNKFFRGLITWTGFRQTGIPFNRPPRAAGESKAYLKTVIGVAVNGIFSFSSLPIYVPFIFSAFLSILFVILLYLHAFTLALGVFISILLFFVLGIILEYLRRIFQEVQNRPHFMIRQKVGFKK